MYIKASFTVEAAILVPLITLILSASVGVAVKLHEQTKGIAREGAAIKIEQPVQQWYGYQLQKTLKNEMENMGK